MQRQLMTRRNRYWVESDDETDEWFEKTDEETNELYQGNNENNGIFQVNPSLTKLKGDKLRILRPGDHITCHRPYIIYHHAIVVAVDPWGDRLQVIHYTTVKGKRKKAEIVKEWLSRDQLSGDWYRIDYPHIFTEMNNTEKVLERAHSRLGEADYEILSNNCESFASFCKTGVSDCFQTNWLEKNMKGSLYVNAQRVACQVPKIGRALADKITSDIAAGAIKESTAKIAIAEGFEKFVNGSNYVGGGLVVAAEACSMARDIRKMYSKRKEGEMSPTVFTEMATQRVTEAVGATAGSIGVGLGFEIGGGIIGGTIGSAVPVIGTAIGSAIGAFIGSILGGIIGSVVGRACGSLLGPQVAKITTKFVRDDVPAKTRSCTIL